MSKDYRTWWRKANIWCIDCVAVELHCINVYADHVCLDDWIFDLPTQRQFDLEQGGWDYAMEQLWAIREGLA